MAPRNPGWITDADGRKSWPLDSYQMEGERMGPIRCRGRDATGVGRRTGTTHDDAGWSATLKAARTFFVKILAAQ
jgi:hypothetical protein